MRKSDMVLLLGVAENGMTWQEWRLASGIDKNRFNRRVTRLVKDGEVIKENGRYVAMPSVKDLAAMEDDE
jgi:hypothetical protein